MASLAGSGLTEGEGEEVGGWGGGLLLLEALIFLVRGCLVACVSAGIHNPQQPTKKDEKMSYNLD